MAKANGNFTEDGNHKTYEQLLCSAELTGGIRKELICFIVLNVLLSITAFLGNSLILVALYKETSLHPPSKLLLRTLTISDLCVGIIAEPLYVTYLMSVLDEGSNIFICRYAFVGTHITAYILSGVSLYTLTAISVDRLLALLLGLRYRQLVSLKRTYLSVIMFWILSIIGTTMHFWNYLINFWYSNIAILVCLVTSFFSYSKIFLTLRHNQNQVQVHAIHGQPSQAIQLNIARYRKTVSSVLWVKLTLVVCYLPVGILQVLRTQRGLSPSLYLASSITRILVFLNSSLNPILYCWKIREVRQAVKDTIRHFWCSSS